MTSEKQATANQRNAQHSTGPRDASRTKGNATKHGLTAKMETALDEAPCANTLKGLVKHFQPQGPIEIWLVGQLV